MAVTPDGHEPSTTDLIHGLPCGRTVEEVADQVEAGRFTEHTLDCPHCSTARASLEQLAEATRELVDDPVEPPPALFDRILDAVRVDLLSSRGLALPAPGVDISPHALAAVLRFAADSVPGVRAHRCRIEPVPDDRDAVRVWMSVSLDYRSGSIDALDAVRDRVRGALSDRIGLRLHELGIEVADLWMDGGDR